MVTNAAMKRSGYQVHKASTTVIVKGDSAIPNSCETNKNGWWTFLNPFAGQGASDPRDKGKQVVYVRSRIRFLLSTLLHSDSDLKTMVVSRRQVPASGVISPSSTLCIGVVISRLSKLQPLDRRKKKGPGPGTSNCWLPRSPVEDKSLSSTHEHRTQLARSGRLSS